MYAFIVPVLLVIANVLGAGMIVPQVVRLHRQADTDGLSGAWVGVGLAMNGWWLAYGLQAQLWGLIPVSAVAGVLYAVIALQLISLLGVAAALRSLATGAVGLGIIPAPFLLSGGWTAAGVAIGFCYGLQFAPAALTAVRSERLAGISAGTWIMAWVEAAIWIVYGLSISDWALTIGGSAGAAMASIILFQLATTTPVVNGARNVRTIPSTVVEV